MAPALTEPLSSAEKLSSSTASAAPSTRSTRKYDSVSSTYSARAVNSSHFEKSNNSSSSKPSTSRRVTRSKDAYQRIFEQAVTDKSSSYSASQLSASQENVSANNNEQMGLSAANSNKKNNINNNNNIEPSATSSENISRRNNTTEQLLADLTNDFEEAITAEIYLRKQLHNSHLAKRNSETNKRASKDIVVIKAGSGSSPEVSFQSQSHMESHAIGEELTNKLKDPVTGVPDDEEQHQEHGNKKQKDKDLLLAEGVCKKPHSHLNKRPKIISVEELPPASTDSTMTASEIEDNLEERLSQLDGGDTPATSAYINENVTLPLNSKGTTFVISSKTPIQQHMHQVFPQQQVQQTPMQFAINNSPQSTNNMLSNVHLTQSITKDSTTGGGGDEIQDQDIEEVLKALKGMDGNTGADTLCDLNVLFNEVYTTLNYEDINNQQAAAASKPSPLQELRMDIERIQLTMQRKLDFLLRRMRKMQARYMCKHASEEIAGIFEWCARVASKNRGGNLNANAPSKSAITVISARPPPTYWDRDKEVAVSSSQMYTLLRKLESSANSQQICTTPNSSWNTTNNYHSKRGRKGHQQDIFGSPTSSTNANNLRKHDMVVPTLDTNVVEEMGQVAGLLQTEMREVQKAIDSDVTDSSSGCESADEMVIYNNPSQNSLPLGKRAAWRYSRDRAAIASRWSWLLTQIADLEIKIRQHQDLHQEIARKKGAVKCDVDVGLKTTEAPQQSVNGYKGDMMPPLVVSDSSSKEESGTEGPSGSCRTRGFSSVQFRKRKLLQTTNIHTISKKAARPSTLKCGCQWPLNPCALCTGRADPTAPRDLPDTMMKRDRVALLDPGYHPVLSFPEDVSKSIHFESIARLPEWQHRVTRLQPKSIAKHVLKAEREAATAAGLHLPKKYSGGDSLTKRRYIKKKDRIGEHKNITISKVTPTMDTELSPGNGIGSFSTSTTPLVANKLARNMKRTNSQQVGNGTYLEPTTPIAVSGSNHPHHSSSNNNNSYSHQTSDHPRQNYDQFNPNQAHSSLISRSHINSSKNNKYRKYSMTNTNAFNHHHHHNNNNHHIHHNNHQSKPHHHQQPHNHHHNSNGNSDGNFSHTNENCDNFAARSRTSSPTHGYSSNYHKYERSLDRKNRISYDIDNIVIPYSVAAATRVEILPYKEIPTPKWRVISDEKSICDVTSSEETDKRALMPTEPLCNGIEKIETDTAPKCINDEQIPIAASSVEDEKVIEEDAPSADSQDEIVESKEKENDELPADKKNNNVLKEIINKKNEPETTEQPSAASAKENDPDEDARDEPSTKKLKLDISDDGEKNDTSISDVGYKELEMSSSSSSCEWNDATRSKRSEKDGTIEEYVKEDISDESMKHRHERALTEERRKFQTFLKFPWSTRSRANRRIDSRAESSGANTPDPASPAPQTPSGGCGEQESIPSPLAPSTPLNPMDNITETIEEKTPINSMPPQPASSSVNFFNKRHERRRTTSAKKDLERRSLSPDPRELVPPYEPLTFPLADEVFESLLQEMPSCSQDDSKSFEDCHPLTNKLMRQKSGAKYESNMRRTMAKSTISCDVNNKRHRQNNAVNTLYKPIGNGAIFNHKTAEDSMDMENELSFENIIFEQDDDDDGYPKHHLAPNDDDEEYSGTVDEDEYEAYVGEQSLLDSENESSDAEPFEDDDPNDPEWRGGSEDRIDKPKRRFC